MTAGKKCLKSAVVGALAAMGLAFGVMPNQAKAATSYYFDVNGNTGTLGLATNNSTYSWDGASVWNTSSTGAVNPAAWVAGGFARLTVGGSTTTYNVTVANSESMAGLYLTTAGTLNINQAPSTSGNLSVVTGVQGFLVATSGSVYVNAPITGIGGVSNSLSGSLFLYGNNTYSGGTQFTSSSGINYNSANSFGTGSINYASGTTFGVIADPDATAPITLTNAVVGSPTATSTLLITGAQPTTFTGAWTMTGTSSLSIGNTPFPNAAETISGNIGGASANIIKSGTATSVLTISGTANTYSGTTTVTAGTLKLGAANTIASSSKVIMNGGTLDPDDLAQLMATTTMSMSAASTISYAAGNAADLEFANSAAQTWTGTLNLTNWTTGLSLLRFGTDTTGLTSAQLADIEFNGVAGTLGTAHITATGYIVPEPTTAAILLIGAPMLAARRRRRA